MADKAYGFTEEGAKRIVDSVRRLERDVQNIRSYRQHSSAPQEWAILAVLDEDLSRGTLAGGNYAYASVYASPGGIDSGTECVDTGDTVVIYDAGILPTSKSPIAAGTTVIAVWCGGRWNLVAADVC